MRSLVILVVVFVFYSCSSLEKYVFDSGDNRNRNAYTKDNLNTPEISKVTRNAKYDVYNRLIYSQPQNYVEQIVSVSGTIQERPPFSLGENTISISGYIGNMSAGDYFNFILRLDNPLPLQSRIDQDVEKIIRGQQYRVFFRFKEIKEFLSDYGQPTRLPVGECLLIYKSDDFSFQKPLWVSNSLYFLPNGEVRVDSLKYKFER